MTTIHYEGVLSDLSKKNTFLNEIRTFATQMAFRVTEIDEPSLSGVVLGGWEGMEPIPFIFDSDGELHSFFEVLLPDPTPYKIVSVKTHNAGVEGHIGLCRLLQHVKAAYLPDLKVTDESGFWEQQDESALRQYFNKLDRFADAFVDHLQNDVVIPPEADLDTLTRGIVQAAEMARRMEEEE